MLERLLLILAALTLSQTAIAKKLNTSEVDELKAELTSKKPCVYALAYVLTSQIGPDMMAIPFMNYACVWNGPGDKCFLGFRTRYNEKFGGLEPNMGPVRIGDGACSKKMIHEMFDSPTSAYLTTGTSLKMRKALRDAGGVHPDGGVYKPQVVFDSLGVGKP